MSRLAVTALAALVVVGCREGTAPVDREAPVTAAAALPAAAQSIPGRYIVRFTRDVTDAPGLARQLITTHGGQMHFTYSHAIKGFAATLSDQAVNALRHNPHVAYVEPDQEMHAIAVQSPTPSWGLDRVDQRTGLNNAYSFATTASNVIAYIIDTGIRLDHVDFGGRAVTGVDEVTAGGNANDCNGHGTHVSGTVGGNSFGIAKGVTLVAVRVLGCNGSGSLSGVIAGIDFVTSDHSAGGSRAGRPAVANMSLGGGFSQSLNDAVAASVAAGVVYAVAAGNESTDACTESPSSTPSAITVGASDINDRFASFSNFGSCVDVLAPGVGITSDWATSSTATNTISGTSMATPHVTGAAALYLSGHTGATPSAVANALVASASCGHVTGVPQGTPNKLLFTLTADPADPACNGGGGGGGQALALSGTYSCSGFLCHFDASATTGATSFLWTFGDGASATTAIADHQYRSRGTFTVRLTVANATSSQSATATIRCSRNGCR
ncbi:MAG TPA: S8 family serine peptidase [Gemmatimonadaceae bacterium]|nr:S8 family serine peptidase [Gemmatimonadaceae bacterium]